MIPSRSLKKTTFLSRIPFPCVAATCLAASAVAPLEAAIITNGIPGVTAFAYHQGDSGTPDGDGGVNNVTNGDGLTVGNPADSSTWVHDAAWQTGWQGQGAFTANSAGAGSASTPGAWFIADLGASTTNLDSMHIWNVREVPDRGARNVDVFYAVAPTTVPATGIAYDFTSGGWTPLLTGHIIPQGGAGGTDSDDVIDLTSVAAARYVGIRINSNYNSTFRVGFSEIQFATIPEPASMGLLALAGLALTGRRRKAS